MRSTDIAAALAALGPVAATNAPAINLNWGQNENARRLANICDSDARPDIITLSGACVDPTARPSIDCREVLADAAKCQAKGTKILVKITPGTEGLVNTFVKTFPTVDGFDLTIDRTLGKAKQAHGGIKKT